MINIINVLKTIFWGLRWILALLLVLIVSLGLSNGYGDKNFAMKLIGLAFLLISYDLFKLVKFFSE